MTLAYFRQLSNDIELPVCAFTAPPDSEVSLKHFKSLYTLNSPRHWRSLQKAANYFKRFTDENKHPSFTPVCAVRTALYTFVWTQISTRSHVLPP